MEKRKSMKKLLLSSVAVLILTFAIAMSAMAEVIPPLDEYHVTFTSDAKMKSNFKSSDIFEQASAMQPGDYTDIVLSVKNEHKATTHWYMTNEVLKTLEDTRDAAALSGGAYTYRLAYKSDASGKEKVIFSSEVVGGDNVSEAGEGLLEATDALDEWFYLDSLSTGQGGTLTLHVALDGETQGNDYQDTLARLQMNFAVELQPEKEVPPKEPDEKHGKPKTKTPKKRKVVKTGDYTNYTPYLIAAGVSGLAILLLAIYSLRERRRQRGGNA